MLFPIRPTPSLAPIFTMPVPNKYMRQMLLSVVVILAFSSYHLAPSASRAPLSSLIAVGTSSKFSADIAHLACFCAFITASSSTTMLGMGVGAGGAGEYAG